MRFLIDANLPRWFAPWSTPEFEFVLDFNPAWSDTRVWQYAVANGQIIVSKDADFSARALATQHAAKVIHVRTGNLPMRQFHAVMSVAWPMAVTAIGTAALVLVYSDRLEVIA